MSTCTSDKGVTAQIFTSAILSASLGLMTLGTAHAEQYCKSVDKDGNATYTLAPDSGCSVKKYKTVAIHHHISSPVPIVPKSDSVKTDTTAPIETTKIKSTTE